MAIWEEITCKKCRQKVHISNVKCNLDGDLICVSCLDNINTKKLEKKQPSTKSKERINYQCLRCRYRFSFGKDSRAALRCPYCDSTNIQRIMKQGAQAWVKKAGNDLYDF